MTGARFGHVYTMLLSNRMGVRWMLKVLGKGGKWRSVPLTSKTIEFLRMYLQARGLGQDPSAQQEDMPVIARLGSNAPMSDSMLYKLLKGFFRQAAAHLRAAGEEHAAQSMDRASVHWLRHTCGVHLATSNVPVNLIQKLLGHASLATTSIYTEADDERLWEAVESQS
jgi:site-specific recombinase XerD